MQLLSVREAAERLGISKVFLDRARVSGDGPRFVRLSAGRVGYDPVDLEEWVAARKYSSTAQYRRRA